MAGPLQGIGTSNLFNTTQQLSALQRFELLTQRVRPEQGLSPESRVGPAGLALQVPQNPLLSLSTDSFGLFQDTASASALQGSPAPAAQDFFSSFETENTGALFDDRV